MTGARTRPRPHIIDVREARARARHRLRSSDSAAVPLRRCPPIHMVIVGPLRYLTFIKCTASDPFRLSVRLQEFLSQPVHAYHATNALLCRSPVCVSPLPRPRKLTPEPLARRPRRARARRRTREGSRYIRISGLLNGRLFAKIYRNRAKERSLPADTR